MSEAVSSAKPKLWTQNYILIFVANFVTLSAGNMFTSPYALHMTSLGGTDMNVGVSAFTYAVFSLLMKPVAAWFLDNRSRKKIYIFGGQKSRPDDEDLGILTLSEIKEDLSNLESDQYYNLVWVEFYD